MAQLDPFALVVVTGMSGAGKSQAMTGLEDAGLFCIDNLPPSFLPPLVDLHASAERQGYRLAVAIDARASSLSEDPSLSLRQLDELDIPHVVVFLDCSDEVLVRRFSETRRRHPLRDSADIAGQVARERQVLASVRERADYIIDTTHLKAAELRERVAGLVTGDGPGKQMLVEVTSFGFKHGVPLDADIVFDVRFLPNPYYEPDLRALTGLDEPVSSYVLENAEAERWLDETSAYLRSWLPSYAHTDRSRLSIAVGCTGGQHRSIALAEALGRRLREVEPELTVRHRDLSRVNREAGASL